MIDNASELVLVVGAIIGGITSLFIQMKTSRCTDINLCWNCIVCKRQIKDIDDDDNDLEAQNNIIGASSVMSSPNLQSPVNTRRQRLQPETSLNSLNARPRANSNPIPNIELQISQ